MSTKDKNRASFEKKKGNVFKDIYYTWIREFRLIFKDTGILMLLVLAPLAYPVLYSCIYKNEALYDVPIAVVDHSATAWSRKYIRSIDATPDIRVAEYGISFDEAKQWYQHGKVHGIIVIPSDFQDNIYNQKQAHVAVFTDMSSFLYYRALMGATSFAGKDLGVEIQTQRLQEQGSTMRQAEITATPFSFSNNVLYNPGAGYGSFLLPAVLILIIQQTLVLGIGMAEGTYYEKFKKLHLLQISGKRQSVFSVLVGKMLCYLLLYSIMTFYITYLIPHLFNLPLQENPVQTLLFMLPFLLSIIFFALTLSAFLKHREQSMLLFLFTTIPLLFISGISWPGSAVPEFWKVVGRLIPSTYGINGYVRLNSMQATLSQVSYEYLHLWILTGVYFLTAYFIRIWMIRKQNSFFS